MFSDWMTIMDKKLILTLLTVLTLFFTHYASAKTMKSHHKNAGLNCADCHISKPFEAAPMEQCLTCHELPQKRQDYHGAPDKHDSPHYGVELECENCHAEHETSENFCNNCHEFEFNVP